MLVLTMVNLVGLILMFKILKIDKAIKNVIYAYIVFSFFILVMSQLNPIGLYNVNYKVYLMWIINIDIFLLIYTMIIGKYKSDIQKNETIDKILNSKLILYLQIILMFILAYYSYRFNLIVKSTIDASQIRIAAFTQLFNSYTESILYNYGIVTLYRCMTILTSILIVNKKIKNPICILGIMNIILYMTVGYGRMNLYEFAIFSIITFFIYHSNTEIKINLKKMFVLITLIILLLVLSLIPLAIRVGINPFDFEKIYNVIIEKQLMQIITYFTGGFRALDIFLYKGFNLSETIMPGKATFGGIDEFIEIIMTAIGKEYTSFNTLVGEITQRDILIGDNIYFNAFYTCIMNFYFDFGDFGIIIGPVIHAMLVGYCTINMCKQKNIISQILFIFTIMNLFSSIYRWNYQSGSTTFTLLIMIILNMIIKRRKKSENTLDSKYDISISSQANRT